MSADAGRDDLAERLQRLERQIEAIEGLADAGAREHARSAIGELLELHGDGLERIVAVLREESPAALQRLATDPLTRGLLLMHNIHPKPLEERVHEALETVRPYMKSHAGGIEVLGLDNGVLRVRLEGTCNGCASSAATLRTAVETALLEAAPDLVGLEVEGAVDEAPKGMTFIPLSEIGGLTPAPAPTEWEIVYGIDAVTAGSATLRDIADTRIVLARLGDGYFAYGSTCPGCGATLGAGTIVDGHLGCAACDRRYDVVGAGRCAAEPALHLDPFPLIVQGAGTARVAVPVAAAAR